MSWWGELMSMRELWEVVMALAEVEVGSLQ